MRYVMSDLHGCYDEFMEMLDLIKFNNEDTLYILGDIIDRGPEPLKTYQYIKDQPNIKMSLGNHEDMMLWFYKEMSIRIGSLNYKDALDLWYKNGGRITREQFGTLSKEDFDEMISYFKSLPLSFFVGKEDGLDDDYLLVHAGVYPFDEDNPKKLLDMQGKDDITWIRDNFIESSKIYPFKIVFGHTPVPNVLYTIKCHNRIKLFNQKKIELCNNDEFSYGKYAIFNNKIAIDGGCVYGRTLTCMRLEDNKMFFIDGKDDYTNKFRRTSIYGW
jgi:serine/threonine protein phosphatase 1